MFYIAFRRSSLTPDHLTLWAVWSFSSVPRLISLSLDGRNINFWCVVFLLLYNISRIARRMDGWPFVIVCFDDIWLNHFLSPPKHFNQHITTESREKNKLFFWFLFFVFLFFSFYLCVFVLIQLRESYMSIWLLNRSVDSSEKINVYISYVNCELWMQQGFNPF